MPFPLVALGLIAGAGAVGAGANLYSQNKQRELYRYQKVAYERQIADYKRNVGRQMRYPELGPYGRIRALDTGISQSYASSVGTGASLAGHLAAGYGYARRGGLFSAHRSKTSRWL